MEVSFLKQILRECRPVRVWVFFSKPGKLHEILIYLPYIFCWLCSAIHICCCFANVRIFNCTDIRTCNAINFQTALYCLSQLCTCTDCTKGIMHNQYLVEHSPFKDIIQDQ